MFRVCGWNPEIAGHSWDGNLGTVVGFSCGSAAVHGGQFVIPKRGVANMTETISMGDMNPVMEMLKDVKAEVSEIKKSCNDMNREMGSVQQSLRTLFENGKKVETDVAAIRQMEIDCTARVNHSAVLDRLEKIESRSEREDATGRVDIAKARLSGNGNSASFKSAFVRMLPWIIVAALAGAAIGGYSLALSAEKRVEQNIGK